MTFIDKKKSRSLLSFFFSYLNLYLISKNMESQFYSTFLHRTKDKKSRNSVYLTHEIISLHVTHEIYDRSLVHPLDTKKKIEM